MKLCTFILVILMTISLTTEHKKNTTNKTQEVSLGQKVTVICGLAKPGNRVIWYSKGQKGKKEVIYDGKSLKSNVTGYDINNSSGVPNLEFVATKETVITYICQIEGDDHQAKERTLITLSGEESHADGHKKKESHADGHKKIQLIQRQLYLPKNLKFRQTDQPYTKIAKQRILA